MKGRYVLNIEGMGGYLKFSSLLAKTIIESIVHIHSQSFSAYCIKIWQSNEFVVIQVARFSRLSDLLTKLILDILVDGKKR